MGLFGFGKKKDSTKNDIRSTDDTFRARVEDFWNWWMANSERLLATIDAGNCAELTEEVSEQCSALWGHFGWVFGPAPEGVEGHSFTLTGEGILHRQFLTEYWLTKAPDLPAGLFMPRVSRGRSEDGSNYAGSISPSMDSGSRRNSMRNTRRSTSRPGILSSRISRRKIEPCLFFSCWTKP